MRESFWDVDYHRKDIKHKKRRNKNGNYTGDNADTGADAGWEYCRMHGEVTMNKIKIKIDGRVAEIESAPEVVADNAEYEVDFALDPREGWNVSLPITALFVRRDGSYTARILDAGATSCTMPPQTGTNIVFIGLTQDDMRTTTPATIKVHRSIRAVANDPLPAPTEDVYAQILAAYAGIKILSGKGAPTSETHGEVNQLYRDEDTQKLYICTATDGGYTWAEVFGGGSGGSVVVDATLTKAGQAADAKAAGDAIGKKIDKAQGTGNAGKILGIGADGNVTPQDKPVQALAGASAPTTATAGVVGQEYYVIVDNAVTEMYVCTAVANGTYTWYKVEYGAEESDPTVPAWAKEAQKPSYTASEVGADPSGTAASQVSAHNTGTDTHSDIRLLISGLTDRLNALADSDDTTMDQISEVVAYIKANRELITSITTDKVSVSDIIDNLTTNVTNKPLSAAQGVSLKALIDGIVIPDKLPNPNALTFTGAVTGSYDGSAPLSVAIPSGGGAEKSVRHIATVSVTAGTTSYSVTVDSNGDPLNLKSVYILTEKFWSNGGSYVQVKINKKEVTRAYGDSGSPQALAFEKMGELQKFTNIPKPSNVGISFGDYYNGKSAVTSVDFWSAASTVDTTIEIYGVDA